MKTTPNQEPTTENQILKQLEQFTGTEHYYNNGMNKKILYTDGVKFLAEKCGAYWLIDEIINHLIFKNLIINEFITVDLIKTGKSAKLIFDDGNGNVLYKKNISFTDFPLEKIRLFYSNNVILLPSEN